MSIEVGEKLSGKVSGITHFGAFIDLGNQQTGLVHISEISHDYVKDIKDLLSVGDTVTVKVLSINPDGKIGLSIRQAVEPKVAEAQEASKPKKTEYRGKSSTPPRKKQQETQKKQDFDSLMSSFLKDSDDRLSALRRNTEGKRGGRGGRRS